MKVLITAPPFYDLDAPEKKGHLRICPSLGLYLLTGVLEDRGHRVTLVDPADFESALGSPSSLAAALSGQDALALSVNTFTWPRARSFLATLAERALRPLVILGGPQATILPDHLLRDATVDYLLRGEAELSFPLLLETLERGQDPARVPGLSFRKNREAVHSPPPPLLAPDQLFDLPRPRFERMPPGYYDFLPVETSRGCRHDCVFCSIQFRRNWRGVSPEQMARRLESLTPFLEKTRERAFLIIDDCFTADHPRLIRAAELLQNFPHRLSLEARVTDLIAPGTMAALARLPVQVLDMGVEAGYDQGLAKVGKKLNLSQVREAAQLLIEHGLQDRTRFSFIMGLPWETFDQIRQTLQFAFKLTSPLGARLIVTWLNVLPGSRIWRRRKEWGIMLSEKDYDRETWWRDEDLFRRAHPLLDLKSDLPAVLVYLALLKKLFPNIQHDGFIRRL